MTSKKRHLRKSVQTTLIALFTFISFYVLSIEKLSTLMVVLFVIDVAIFITLMKYGKEWNK